MYFANQGSNSWLSTAFVWYITMERCLLFCGKYKHLFLHNNGCKCLISIKCWKIVELACLKSNSYILKNVLFCPTNCQKPKYCTSGLLSWRGHISRQSWLGIFNPYTLLRVNVWACVDLLAWYARYRSRDSSLLTVRQISTSRERVLLWQRQVSNKVTFPLICLMVCVKNWSHFYSLVSELSLFWIRCFL